MDITSLYYFTEVAKDLHITKTANRLYISQQTLSNHIQRLEEYYGTALLHRKPRLSLTYAGEYVLNYARLMVKEETNLKDVLTDVEQMERGAIHFGASPLRMHVLTAILPEFSTRFPHVEMKIINSVSKKLAPMVAEGKLDFAIINHKIDQDDPNLLNERLIRDQIYFCVADSLLEKHYGAEAAAIRERSKNGAHLRDFTRLPINTFDNFMGNIIQRSFDEEKVTPHCYINSPYSAISTATGFQGLAGFFATRVMLISQNQGIPEGINIFPLLCHEEPVYLDIFLIRNRHRYLTHYSKHFMELVFQYYEEAFKARIEAGAGAILPSLTI